MTSTLDRSALVAVQTPQAFRAAVLRRAHAQRGSDGTGATDDAVLVEALGRRGAGGARRTRQPQDHDPDDLRAAERLLGPARAEA